MLTIAHHQLSGLYCHFQFAAIANLALACPLACVLTLTIHHDHDQGILKYKLDCTSPRKQTEALAGSGDSGGYLCWWVREWLLSDTKTTRAHGMQRCRDYS